MPLLPVDADAPCRPTLQAHLLPQVLRGEQRGYSALPPLQAGGRA